MTRDERLAMAWLADNAPPNGLVAAAPDTGLYIPGWSGQRVFYGHPAETASAERREAELRAFFATGDISELPYVPDYVFYGARERALHAGDWQPGDQWPVAHREGTVTIYAVPQD
jgi:hypothetical protein